MKAVLVGLIVAVASVGSAFAQQQTDPSQYDPQNWFKHGCPLCGIKSAIDWVQTAEVDGVTRPVIAGWGFECVSGKAIERVDTFAWTPAKGYVPVPTELRWQGIARPDVLAAGCAGNSASGFGAVVTGTLPEGTTKLLINVWQGPYSQQTTIPVLVR